MPFKSTREVDQRLAGDTPLLSDDEMSHDVTFSKAILPDLGITRKQSSDWQKMAENT